MKQAGFTHPYPRKFTHLIVTQHPNLPGYVIKAYLDSQRYFKQEPDYIHWIKRIQGAALIKEYIEGKNLQSFFKVPQKWIYFLPKEPEPPEEFLKKYTILIEEDMELLNHQENKKRWMSEYIDESFLNTLYFLLKDLGLKDCAKPDNIPFCQDGKVAFIDTETFHETSIQYDKLTPYLSRNMRKYWEKLYSSKTNTLLGY